MRKANKNQLQKEVARDNDPILGWKNNLNCLVKSFNKIHINYTFEETRMKNWNVVNTDPQETSVEIYQMKYKCLVKNIPETHKS